MKNIIILGVGHNTPVFIDLALDCGYRISAMYHYNNDLTGKVHSGYAVAGSFDDLFASSIAGKSFLLTMGNIQIRRELTERIIHYGGHLPTLVHPWAVVSRFARISPNGVIVNAFSHIQANTIIEDGVVILSGVIICHNNRIGKNSFIADKATIGAFTTIGTEVFFGQGSLSISNKVHFIGDGAFVGANSLLTKNVPSKSVVYGSPACIKDKVKDSELLLTVICLTFNHAQYICQCLTGIVNQQTRFAFEVIIHDDHSTDDTVEIIKSFQTKYPNLIFPIYEEENQYSKIGFSGIDEIVHRHRRGKYVALCEGDDYWTDPYKLQKQVDFLELNPDYGMVYTQATVQDEKTKDTRKAWAQQTCFEDMLLKLNRVVTPTVVYRTELYDQYVSAIQPKKSWKMGDYPLWLFAFSKSKVKFLDIPTAVYRCCAESASHSQDIKKSIDFILNTFSVRLHIDKILCNEQYHRKIVIKAINDLFDCSKEHHQNLGGYILKFAKENNVINLRIFLKVIFYYIRSILSL